jgi:hypothetical protein
MGIRILDGTIKCFANLFAKQTTEAKMTPAEAHPVFEVAAIKLADSNEKRDDVKGRHVLMENIPVTAMLVFSYSVTPKQVLGLPDWAKSEHWDVDGVPDVEGTPSLAQTQGMIQGLWQTGLGRRCTT